jgi:hypothetical protein
MGCKKERDGNSRREPITTGERTVLPASSGADCPTQPMKLEKKKYSIEQSYSFVMHTAVDYPFLAGRDEVRFGDGCGAQLNWNNAWWLSELAMFAYIDPLSQLTVQGATVKYEEYVKKLGFPQFTFISGTWQNELHEQHEADVLVLEDDRNNAFFLFRGTEPFSVIDWSTDFQVDQTPPHATAFKDAEAGAKLHRGFHDSFLQIFDGKNVVVSTSYQETKPVSLKNLLETRIIPGGRKIWVGGHSLGGALAGLFTYYALLNKLNLEATYTIGAPAVGNFIFADHYKQLSNMQHTATWRIVNSNDVVTQVPPKSAGYEQIGTEIFIDSAGRISKEDNAHKHTDRRAFSTNISKDVESKINQLAALPQAVSGLTIFTDLMGELLKTMNQENITAKTTGFYLKLFTIYTKILPKWKDELEQQGYDTNKGGLSLRTRVFIDGLIDHDPQGYINSIWNDKIAQ